MITHNAQRAKRGSNARPTICSQCRARKVRCDGKTDTCGNCDRLGFHCSFQGGLESEGSAVHRHRSQYACTGCKRRKTRCSGSLPKCTRCEKNRLDCVYPGRRDVFPETTASVLPAGDGEECAFPPLETSRPLIPGQITSELIPEERERSAAAGGGTRESAPSDALTDILLATFFERVAPISIFSFLHRASVMERHREGMLDEVLLLALCGITCLMADVGPEAKEAGPRYIDRAEGLILRAIEEPTITKVQALIFIIKHRTLSRRFSGAFMLVGVAMRFAIGLRLNYEDPELLFLSSESCRRTMWSLYMIDTVLGAGTRDFTLCPAESLNIQLPCPEANFQLDMPDTSPGLSLQDPSSAAQVSPHALVIRAMWLRQRCLEHNKRVLRNQEPDVYEKAEALQGELTTYANHLPKSYERSSYTARLHAHSTTLAAYATIHIAYLGAHCILYRLVLAGMKGACSSHTVQSWNPGFRATCELRCLENAKAIVDFCGTLLASKVGKPVIDFDLAVVVYHAATTLGRISYLRPDMLPKNELERLWSVCQESLESLFGDCDLINCTREDLSTLRMDAPSVSTDQGTRGAWPIGCQRDSSHTNRVLSIQSLVGGTEASNESEDLAPYDGERFSRVAPPQQPALSCSPTEVGPTGAASRHSLLPRPGHRADHAFNYVDDGFHDDIEEWLLAYGMPGAEASLDLLGYHHP